MIDIAKIKENVQVEDNHIILGEPLELLKYGKRLKVKQINWIKQWHKFAYYLGVFLKYYTVICETTSLPDTIDDIEKFRSNIQMTISNKIAFKMLMKMCSFTGAKIRWMKKYFSIDDFIELFIYEYLYNIMGVKKNLFLALNAMKAQLN